MLFQQTLFLQSHNKHENKSGKQTQNTADVKQKGAVAHGNITRVSVNKSNKGNANMAEKQVTTKHTKYKTV